MIKHIVGWTFPDEVEGRDKAATVGLVTHALRGLVGKVPTIREFEVVTPQPGLPSSFDVVLYSTFDCADDLAAYVEHPEHRAVAELIGRLRRDRYVVDYDPGDLG